jgi:protoheme IX farnesyltransferase
MIKTKLKNRNLSQEDVFNFSEFFKLMKPRVMSLVIFTCAVGLLMAPNVISTKDAIIGIILVSIGAGAAGALNMVVRVRFRCTDDTNLFKTNTNW